MEYMATLPLVWAALRFDQRGAASASFVVSSIALLGTLRGVGPFITGDANHSLLLLQSFIETMSVATLILGAVVWERKHAERRLQIQDAVSRIVAESPALDEAAPRVLEVLCQRGGWDVGGIWEFDREHNRLVNVHVWQAAHALFAEFASVTRTTTFPPEVGLPGRVWNSRQSAWVPDVTKDGNFPRAHIAAKEGLHAAFGFPIKLGQEILGVVECFSREVRPPDENFLQMVSHIGEQLGQFIERKRAEDKFLEKEAQVRLITDSAPVMLAQCEINGRIKFVNRAYAERFGVTPAQIIGKTIRDVVGAEAYAVIEPFIDRVRNGESMEYEREIPYARIGRRLMRAAHVPEKDASGRIVGWVSAITDVTERKRAEAAREKSEALKAAILESALDCVISIDDQGQIVEFNPAAEATFGYTRSEVVGKPLAELIVPTRLRSRHNQGFAEYLLQGKEGLIGKRLELPAVRSDGTEFPAEVSITAVELGGEKIFTAYLRDITEQKRTASALQRTRDELAKTNAELEKRVRERTLELEDAHAALLREMDEGINLEAQLRQAQKLESIGTLAGGIAHDFNNILNIIRGYASDLRNHTTANPELRESVDIIEKTTERGASIVQQLLAIARRNESNFESVKLNPSLERLEPLLKGLFPKTIDIALHLDPAAPVVRADPNQIDQVLLNICVNARDALADGGTLVLTTSVVPGSSLRERFQDVKAQQYACISVTDTGAGMTEDVKSRIFEPFFTTKEQGQGTGLGLSVAYGIITNHGGFIDVVSRPGRGTTFLIYLPLFNVARAVHDGEIAPPPTKARVSSGSGYTVLFVEDEVHQLKLMQRLLESEGYRVVPAADGVEAVEAFLRHKAEISVVVLDLGLPKLNGWQAFQQMQAADPGVQPIVATGYVSPEIKAALAEGRLSAVIMKPYRLDEVLKEIAAAARKSRAGAGAAA